MDHDDKKEDASELTIELTDLPTDDEREEILKSALTDRDEDARLRKLIDVLLENPEHNRPLTPDESMRQVARYCMSYHLGQGDGYAALVASPHLPGIIALGVLTKEGTTHILHAFTRQTWADFIERAPKAFEESETGRNGEPRSMLEQARDMGALESQKKFNA